VAVADLASVETVTVGVGGSGASAADGGDGEDSSFGTDAVAKGGKGGLVGNLVATNTFTSRRGGVGGLASAGTGTLKSDGGAGGPGVGWSQFSIGHDGGMGGASALSGNAQGGKQDNGSIGSAYGGGGGGVGIYASQAARTGPGGANGVVIVELYDKSGTSSAPFDHGTDLLGQADDDHLQYLTEARHNAEDHADVDIINYMDAGAAGWGTSWTMKAELTLPAGRYLLMAGGNIETSTGANRRYETRVRNITGSSTIMNTKDEGTNFIGTVAISRLVTLSVTTDLEYQNLVSASGGTQLWNAPYLIAIPLIGALTST
jgi:hypothetical protein